MEIKINSLIQGAEEAKGVVIVIDVFRAFTTAAIAFTKGVEKIIMVPDISQALELRNQNNEYLCIGELGGVKPKEFDFGNSPFELTQADILGRTLVQSTRAGTVGIDACKNADSIYAASLLTAKSTVRAVSQLNPHMVNIVAMGLEGKVRSDEDEQCALYIRNLFLGKIPDHDSIRELILIGAESEKYDDPDLPHFDRRDRDIALMIDSVTFAIRISRENNLLVARPETF